MAASGDEEGYQASHCPICLDDISSSAVCVLPACFHMLCRQCLQRAAAGSASFACPLCRTKAESWTVTVFRARNGASHGGGGSPPAGLEMDPYDWQRQPRKMQHLLALVASLLAEGAEVRSHARANLRRDPPLPPPKLGLWPLPAAKAGPTVWLPSAPPPK